MPSRTLQRYSTVVAEALFDRAGSGLTVKSGGDAAVGDVTPPGVTGRAGAPSTGVRHTKGMQP
jgi:hypothetical protein